jgi:galacturonosyltransferase
MSNVLLESLACGRPIITTDRPGCREIVEDGINGFVVKQNNLDDLIRKIEKYLSLRNSERRQMGLNGRRKVEAEFDRNIVIGKYLDAIKKAKE